MDNTALFNLTYGLYVIGVKTEEGYGGCIVDAVAQVSMAEAPNLVLGSMIKNFTNERIKAEGEFTLSILPANVNPFVLFKFVCQPVDDDVIKVVTS
jgi:flavin reductase (DIM6/NTAB) family NADH-FMN oxidoreductase RutF